MFLNVCLGSDLHAKLARVFMSMCVFFTHVRCSNESMKEHFCGLTEAGNDMQIEG